MLPEKMPPRLAAVQKLIVDLTILAVALLLLVEGINFTKLSVRTLSPALGISLLIPTIVIPISGALMIVCVLRDLCRDVRQIFPRRSD